MLVRNVRTEDSSDWAIIRRFFRPGENVGPKKEPSDYIIFYYWNGVSLSDSNFAEVLREIEAQKKSIESISKPKTDSFMKFKEELESQMTRNVGSHSDEIPDWVRVSLVNICLDCRYGNIDKDFCEFTGVRLMQELLIAVDEFRRNRLKEFLHDLGSQTDYKRKKQKLLQDYASIIRFMKQLAKVALTYVHGCGPPQGDIFNRFITVDRVSGVSESDSFLFEERMRSWKESVGILLLKLDC